MTNMDSIQESFSDFLFYAGGDGSIKIQVILGDETVWLTQKSMAEIFGVNVPAISKHLSNIFSDGELNENSVISILETTASDGKNYPTKFYNLDAIISVGYRVNSQEATQFRIWATKILKEYLIKGFTIDDERLKQGSDYFKKDYFDELVERVREIRASERRFYQKITDIYAQCSIDYNKDSQITQTFYATVQNKLAWAITGNTAAEIIKLRADSQAPYMGLTSWKNETKGGKIIKTDVSIAKNYLSEDELKELNRIVTMYLDYAELQAQRKKPMKMTDWINRLDSFLSFNEYDILKDAGRISHNMAKDFAEKQYEKFRVIQDKNYESDFDNLVKTTSKPKTIEPPKE